MPARKAKSRTAPTDQPPPRWLRPSTWAIAYASIVIVFGAIYASCFGPGSFTQSTLQLEDSGLGRDKDRMSEVLARAVVDSFEGDVVPLGDGWQIPKRDMLLADLTIEENRVEFTLIGSLLYLDPPDNVAYYAPQGVFIDFVVNPLPSEVVTVDERAVTAHELISNPPLRFAPEVVDPPEQTTLDVLPAIGALTGQASYQVPGEAEVPMPVTATEAALPAILLADEQAVDLYASYRAIQFGDPLAASGSFWRMLYFSGSVLTIGGFGDISPLSAAARVTVTVQAVGGLVIFGFFVNALISRYQPDNKRRGKPRAP